MVVWVELAGCCTCRILMKYFFFVFRHLETKFFHATVNQRGILAIKTMQRWKKGYGNMTHESKHIRHIHSTLMQALRTKTKPAVSIFTDMQIPVNTQTTIWSCRVGLKLWSDNVNWNSCMYITHLNHLKCLIHEVSSYMKIVSSKNNPVISKTRKISPGLIARDDFKNLGNLESD